MWVVALRASRVTGRSVADMRIVMKPIERITTHSKDGVIRPEKYRIIESKETIVVRIDKILARSEEKSVGCRELIARVSIGLIISKYTRLNR